MANILFIRGKSRTHVNSWLILVLGLITLFLFFGARSNYSAEIIALDGNLVRESTGVIYDTDTGLEWYPGPDRGMTWKQAHDWVSALTFLGGGWRMPARQELDALHRIGDGVRNLTPLVPHTGYWIWAGQSLVEHRSGCCPGRASRDYHDTGFPPSSREGPPRPC